MGGVYVEFFSDEALENVMCLLQYKPDRLIYLGHKHTMITKKMQSLMAFAELKSPQTIIDFREVARDNLEECIDVLQEVADEYPDANYELTGGGEMLLIAFGYVTARQQARGEELSTLRIDPFTTTEVHLSNHKMQKQHDTIKITVAENIILHGGHLTAQTGSNTWKFTDESKDAFLMSIWLHDIGKLIVPLEVLDKPDRLGGLKIGLKSKVDIACLKEKVEALENPDKADECNVKAELIKKAWASIEAANNAGFLPDEKLEELRGYANIICKTADGEEVPLLDEKELEAITIRKGTLTDGERKQVQSHVVYTARMLDKMSFKGIYKNVPFWSGSHHEFLNGKGYPNHLDESSLPNESRLLTIIDVYDALTAEDRPYKPPMPPEKAFSILESMRDDGQIDGKLLELFKESKAWVRE